MTSLLALLITILLFVLVSLGQKEQGKVERSLKAKNRQLPPRDIKGKFCKFYTYSQLERDLSGK